MLARNPKPLEVGITGGIGAGKSIVAAFFHLLGVPVYYADDRAKQLMLQSNVKDKVLHEFGEESYLPDGSLNKTHIAKLAYADEHVYSRLNAIVHPEVAKDYQIWKEQYLTSPYLLREAAIMIESGAYKQLDHLILVKAPIELRIARTLERDSHRSRADVEAIMGKQLSDEERGKFADFVISNDDQHLLIPQVLAIHEQLLKSP